MQIKRNSIAAYVVGARPKTLLVAVAPVLVGLGASVRAVGPDHVRWPSALAALVGAIFITIGTNFANDVFDYEKGADTEDRLGPLRVTQAGLLSPRAVKGAMAASFAIAFCAGIFLFIATGWPVIAIGLASIVSGMAYTGGPFPLGYNGLGEVFVFVFFGLVAVCGTNYVSTGSLHRLAWFAAIAPGALAMCVLLVNNVRDIETDRRAHKRTVAVRFGRSFGVMFYGISVALMVLGPVLTVQSASLPWSCAWAPALVTPIGIALTLKLHRERGAILNKRLGQTAALLLLHSLIFSVALAAGR
jgi:1,4-dihydroxy-2-naphthoate octaprenyltransferase